MPKCFFCSNELTWICDTLLTELGIDEEGVCSTFNCDECDVDYDVYIKYPKEVIHEDTDL